MSEKKKRACYLGRVSTLQLSQESSLINQKDQIVEFIKKQDVIFNEETDCFEDKVSGTKIKKNNQNEKGFDTLMSLLNLEIEDTNNKDYTEVKIKINKNKKPKYNIIYCKSTSRINRAGSKGQSLIEILKANGIEVYFFDLHKSTFEMEDVELSVFSMIDNRYSKTMSFNTRNNKVLKTQNRELMLHGERFGWNLIKKDGKRYFVKNEYEYNAIRIMVKMLLEEDKGCGLIEQKLKELDIKNKNGRHLDKTQINKILKDKHYIGMEKYYHYDENYTRQFQTDRSYLKELDFQWLPCEYIEPLITEEEFNLIQQKFSARSNGQSRGVRYPYKTMSRKLVCGVCKGNLYSMGASNFYKENAYECASVRRDKINKIPRHNNRLYENFIYEYLENNLPYANEQRDMVVQSCLTNLFYLKCHLVLLLNNEENNFDLYETKISRKEELEEQLEQALLNSFSSDSAKKVLDNLIAKIDTELKQIEKDLSLINSLKEKIEQFLKEIIELENKFLAQYEDENIKIETVQQFLDNIKFIYVFPRKAKYHYKNAIKLHHTFYIEDEVFNLFDKINKSDIMNLFDTPILNLSIDTLGKEFYSVFGIRADEHKTAVKLLKKFGA